MRLEQRIGRVDRSASGAPFTRSISSPRASTKHASSSASARGSPSRERSARRTTRRKRGTRHRADVREGDHDDEVKVDLRTEAIGRGHPDHGCARRPSCVTRGCRPGYSMGAASGSRGFAAGGKARRALAGAPCWSGASCLRMLRPDRRVETNRVAVDLAREQRRSLTRSRSTPR